MADCPAQVLDLVERFEHNRESYLSPSFNETELRVTFVNPFFEALGWDVHNKQGHAEAYKDVIHEDAIRVGGATKAPDYCFRIGGARKFFVETKKPAVQLAKDPMPAYQLRRYAWSAKLPLSVLTDFEEFALYDCRVRPGASDKPSKGRVMLCGYEQYAEHWKEIAGILSKEAVLKGDFDRYVTGTKKKRGTAEVDDAFLAEIENWRDLLARNFALRNQLSVRELNYAVQCTIDRIIFLRMCEDRGVERYGELRKLLNGERVYRRMFELFERADDRYNSGLFHFHPERSRTEPPDELTPKLQLDDKPLKEILRGLYYPESPYEFSVLPADVLGQVYEQFLGKVIRLTRGGYAKVEDKPEVKKAGGIYYTPTYIVDYIVEHTVGRWLEGKTRRQASRLRILDPACGSGSFLVAAYQYLLDWHRDRCLEDGPDRHRKVLYQGPGGLWFLTTQEKKRILLDNLYGVDIDPQAVEVTKLSLLLKVLEGATRETLEHQRRFLQERALPDLSSNIKCGNSLIGPDFYDGRQMTLLDDAEHDRINAFDWHAEFPKIMKAGGFDVVMGNPPWGQKGIAEEPDAKKYIQERFPSSSGIYDLFRPFVEQGIRLTKADGYFAMVLPDIVLLKDYPQTRSYLLDHLTLRAIDWWGMAFSKAVIDAATIIGIKRASTDLNKVDVAVHDSEAPVSHQIPQNDFRANPRYVFNLYLTPEKRQILARLEACPRLGDYFEVHEGVHSGNIRDELFVNRRLDASCKELLFGRDEIAPYSIQWNGKFVRLSAVPKKKTRARYANAGKPEWYEREKALVRRTGDYVLAAVDRHGRYASNNFFLVFPTTPCALNLDGLCALLNSRFMTWFFRTIEPRQGRVFAELKIKHIIVFPLPKQVLEPDGCEPLNELGREQAKTAIKLRAVKTPDAATRLRRVGESLSARIDHVVETMLGVDLNSLKKTAPNGQEVIHGSQKVS